MKIQKSSHKMLLASCFYQNGMPKEVPKTSQDTAATCFKKLVTINENGSATANSEEIELTPSEIVLMKYLYDQKLTWPWDAEEQTNELNDIFYPPKV